MERSRHQPVMVLYWALILPTTTMKHRSGLLASGARKVRLERALITEDRRPYMYEYYAFFIARRRVNP